MMNCYNNDRNWLKVEKMMAWRKILKWFLYLVDGLLVLIVIILSIFRLQAGLREVKVSSEIAPSTGHIIRAKDINVFIQEEGPSSGTPVILIHGTGAWSEVWRQTMTTLAENGFHAIAIDIPPFGYSEKPKGPEEYSREKQAKRIIGILDSLNISRAILVGHSVGARPTIEAAFEEPNRVQHLILVDPALGFSADQNNSNFEQNNPSSDF